MTDIVDRATRSRMMAGIKSKNTKPEIRIRSELHRLGFRYRLNQISLPGKPDLVLKKHNTVVFVHGCFWHGHECPLFKWPKSNAKFWRKKIKGNRARDQSDIARLLQLGWRVLIIWECAIKNQHPDLIHTTIISVADWIRRGKESFHQTEG
jgi:DNA mismatch endonuclease (patch repair protein)